MTRSIAPRAVRLPQGHAQRNDMLRIMACGIGSLRDAMSKFSGSSPSDDPLQAGLLLLGIFLLLSYPWLSPFLQGRFILGVPLLLVYLFGVWGFTILLVAIKRKGD